MKKVLIIAYNFPPVGGVGAIRIAKFAKYLVKFGWQPVILTSQDGFSFIRDESLLRELPSSIEINRIKGPEPARWFGSKLWQSFWLYLVVPWFIFPDRQAFWIEPALNKARELIKTEKIDLIFSSSGPATNHLVAKRLKEETGIRWVADFRDEWANNPHFNFPTFLHRNRAASWEKAVLESTDHAVSVSEPLTQYLAEIGGKEKCSTITNGFDPEDFPAKKAAKNSQFTLLHAGTLYGTGKNHAFFEAFRELSLPDAKYEFIGQDAYLPHREAVAKMSAADSLVLILSPKPRSAVMSGKLFEYLAARKPILALVPEKTAAAKLILGTKTGLVVDPQDKEKIKKAILDLYHKWQKNDLEIPDIDLTQYDREKLTGQLAEIFNQTLAQKPKICLLVNSRSRQSERLSKYLLGRGYNLTYLNLSEGEMASQGVWEKLKNFNKFKKIIKKIQPDILHGHGLNFAGIFAVKSGFHPAVVTVRGSDVMRADKMPVLIKRQVIETLKNADIVTGSSEALKNKALELGMPADKYRMVYFGIDQGVFKRKAESGKRNYGIKKGEKVIFSCRAMKPIYNIGILIEAVSQLNFDFKLILVKQNADQVYLAKIERLIREKNLQKKVIILPSASEGEMAELYNAADVVVSIAKSDGLSVSFLEAMACEAKIVLSDVGFAKEWHRNDNFWIVPVGDIDATRKAITDALNMPESQFEPIGQKNRQMVLEKAELEKSFEAMEDVYQEFTNKNRP